MDVISSLGVILSEVVTARAKVSIDRLEILPLLASYEHHPIFFARVGPVKQYGIGRAYPRYAIAGVPAAVLLVAFAVGSLPQTLLGFDRGENSEPGENVPEKHIDKRD